MFLLQNAEGAPGVQAAPMAGILHTLSRCLGQGHTGECDRVQILVAARWAFPVGVAARKTERPGRVRVHIQGAAAREQ